MVQLAIGTGDIVLIVGGAVVVVALTLVVSRLAKSARGRRARDHELKRRFGPEYHTTVDELGRRKGAAELERRLDEYDELDLDRVPPSQREAFTDRWREVQFRFVDSPEWSVREAEHVVVDVMRERGLPVDDVESRVGALSVVDADCANRYRDAYATYRAVEDGAHEIAAMFDALRAYRDAFESLLERPQREEPAASAGPPPADDQPG